jgi:hypothetical protein
MRLAILAAFAFITGVGGAAHAGCTGSGCATDEPTATRPPQVSYPCNGSSCATLRSRIENALKDLEIANARALRADQERMDALCGTASCTRPESRESTPPPARCNTNGC